jgi:uncharacterized membrane protein YeaQ/YmgE (transglycosylase-associated protein family)
LKRKAKADDGLNWVERQVLKLIINKLIKKIQNMQGSWRTSVVGWLTIIGTFVGSLLLPVLDADPATVIDWDAVIEAARNAGFVIPVWLIGILSRDKQVSSETQRRAGTTVK